MRREQVAESARGTPLKPRGADNWRSSRSATGRDYGPPYSATRTLPNGCSILAPLIRRGEGERPFGTGRHAPIAGGEDRRVWIGDSAKNRSSRCEFTDTISPGTHR